MRGNWIKLNKIYSIHLFNDKLIQKKMNKLELLNVHFCPMSNSKMCVRIAQKRTLKHCFPRYSPKMPKSRSSFFNFKISVICVALY